MSTTLKHPKGTQVMQVSVLSTLLWKICRNSFLKKRPSLLKMTIKWRTQADGCQETQGNLWRQAGGEERLQDVDRKGESDHGLARGVNHQHSDPQAQEAKGEQKEQEV